MSIKFSLYNYYYYYKNSIYILNLLYNKIIKIPIKIIPINILEIMNNNSAEKIIDYNLESSSNEFLEKLKINNFIVKDCIDESNLILENMKNNLEQNHNIYLSFIPSYDCNLNCSYCYVKNSIKNKSTSIIKNDFETILKNYDLIIRNINPKIINFDYYGGEPILGIENLLKMYNYLKNLDISLHIILYTNGTLLLNNIDKLINININTIQISIDATRLSDYDFVNNIFKFSEIYISKHLQSEIKVRINIDKDFNNTDGLLYFINKYKNRVTKFISPYISFIFYNEKYNTKLSYKKMIEIGNFLMEKEKVNFFNFPRGMPFECRFDGKYSFIMDLFGNIFKCHQYIGNTSKILTYIVNPIFSSIIRKYDEKCIKCYAFPFCHSGCKYFRETKMHLCLREINYIEDMMKSFCYAEDNNL